MSNEIKYPWQQTVVDAFLALPDSLPAKINIAERAISARLTDPQQADLDERTALKDALRALQVLCAELRPKSSHANERKREDVA
jgi:hypothetical protein